MKKLVLSKAFSERLRDFPTLRREDVRKAVRRVLDNPELDSYKRWYLDPYRQEHPADTTITIFFVIPSRPKDRVFFVWVNDDQHPHDTRKSHGDDPCVKEFIRLRDSNLLEQYSEKEHEGELTVSPRKPNTVPTFYKFSQYKASVYANVSFDSQTYFSMAIATSDPSQDIFEHYKLFLEKIREHFLSIKMPFEFRVADGDMELHEILQANIDPSQWKKTQDGDLEIWRIR